MPETSGAGFQPAAGTSSPTNFLARSVAQKAVDPENGALLPSAAMNLPANVLQVVRVVVID
jgi:hypothetical protein